jgi:hypothetical protein
LCDRALLPMRGIGLSAGCSLRLILPIRPGRPLDRPFPFP